MILLLAIMTVSSLSLDQFFKIPVLVVHYFEHKQRGQAITVSDYLSMHYWGTDINDNDDDRDMQLPFKKMNIDQCFLALFSQSRADLVTAHLPLGCSYSILKPQHHTPSHLGSLFKPPRLV
jgi:hypothetical protein